MSTQITHLPHLVVSVIAHQDSERSLLLAKLTAATTVPAPSPIAKRIVMVIDRSGSMSGEKLEITKAAVAEFIRSLDPHDLVGVVAYDDRADLIQALGAPSEAAARAVESIVEGGSTDLYAGWLLGAKLAGDGGRVILLSDGQANCGRYTQADELAKHAARSYQKFGVTTTTIGVGRDYDESLMAGMARSGGGAHYFAHTARSIRDAFSQERYSTEALSLRGLSLRCGSVTEQLGHFWSGEAKSHVFQVSELANLKLSVRYTVDATGQVLTQDIAVPRDFGYSEEARLEWLFMQASDAEFAMVQVRDPQSATQMRTRLRTIVLSLLGHPSSDEPVVRATVDRLKASIERLEQLERNYQEEDATMHRKRSAQSGHNLRQRAQAYSSFEEDAEFVAQHAAKAAAMASTMDLTTDPSAFALASREQWIQWKALPLGFDQGILTVALVDPRRGFQLKEIERTLGCRVHGVFANLSTDEVVSRLKEA